ARVPSQPRESVAVIVNLDCPGRDGVPVSVPSSASASPSGSAPDETRNAYGGTPPLAVNDCFGYRSSTFPSGSGDVVTVIGAQQRESRLAFVVTAPVRASARPDRRAPFWKAILLAKMLPM